MERATEQIAKECQPDAVMAMTYTMARYAIKVNDVFRVVDVDTLMTGMMQDAFQREKGFKGRARRLLAWLKFLRYEKWLYRQFDLCLSVTESDRNKITKLCGMEAGKIGVVPNGALVKVQDPAGNGSQKDTLIFSGALTYQANFDAMEYFLNDIFPLVCKEMPQVSMKITGSTNGVPIHLLPRYDNVIFTGFVEDIKALIGSTQVCVVPLRVGGGTRIKILEAMALGTPVVSTTKGAEGLDVIDGVHLLIADTPEDFARKTILLLCDDQLRTKLSFQARELVEKRYSWQKIQDQFLDLFEAQMKKNSKI
jgi:glycosyltransferase involved in cell wall biosynthesis